MGGEDAPGATKVVTDDDAALLKKSSMRVVNQKHESSTLNVNMNSDDGSSVRLEMKAVVNSAEESQEAQTPADAEVCLNQDSEKLTGNEELMKKTKKMKKKIQETYQNKYPWKLVVLARKQDPEPEPEKNSSDSP